MTARSLPVNPEMQARWEEGDAIAAMGKGRYRLLLLLPLPPLLLGRLPSSSAASTQAMLTQRLNSWHASWCSGCLRCCSTTSSAAAMSEVRLPP